MSAHLLDESSPTEELRPLHERGTLPGGVGNATDRVTKRTGIRALDEHTVDAGSDDVRCPSAR